VTGVGRHADLLATHPHYRYVLTAECDDAPRPVGTRAEARDGETVEVAP
jgi:ATP-binding cassette, subfamily B, bacterial